MSRLHICNTFFEDELRSSTPYSLKEWMQNHKAIRLLQYLPLLYADPSDKILVTELPPHPDPRLQCIDSPSPKLAIDPWAPSLSIERWAIQHDLPYAATHFDLAKEIQSKAFVFSHSSPLPGALLACTEQEVFAWIRQTKGPKVLKQIYGSAGRGHCFPDKHPHVQNFLQAEFSHQRPIVCEPWVQRTLDFSSQWHFGTQIELLGLTLFQTSAQGGYLGTLAGPVATLFGKQRWAADLHLEAVQPLLQTIQQKGFKGHLGIDAMIYWQNGVEHLHPIVEINARKTMSWVALQIQAKTPQHILSLRFDPKPGGLLPDIFSRNLFIEQI